MKIYQLWTLVDRFQTWAPNTNGSDEYVLHSDALAEIAAAEQRGAERERAAIVAWIGLLRNAPMDTTLGMIQDAIMRGDHHDHGREAQP